MRIGEEKEGLINSLAFALCRHWAEHADDVAQADEDIELFVQFIMFGPVHSKGKRYQSVCHGGHVGFGRNEWVPAEVKSFTNLIGIFCCEANL